jgi:hypothetical protein
MAARSKAAPARKPAASHAKSSRAKAGHPRSPRRWSQRVTETSDAMDLPQGVFEKSDPKAIARSLKRSAERSHRRKSAPFRSAMSMLTFYINRAGHNLGARRRKVLERAKDELREQFRRSRQRATA